VTCEERAPQIFLYAAGVLEEEEGREMAAHLSGGCQRCAAELAEAEARLCELYLGLDAVEPSEAVRARLLARVAEAAAAPAARPRGRLVWTRFALAAGVGALVAAGLTAALMDRFGSEPLRTEIVRLESRLWNAASSELAWGIVSETFDPKSDDDAISSVTKKLVQKLVADGLIAE